MYRKLSFIIVVVSTLLLGGMAQAVPIDITTPGDTVQGVPDDSDWPDNEAPPLAIDDNTATKYLHFKGAIGTTGFQVTPSATSIVIGLTFTTANDCAGRDPVVFELYGSNESINGPYTLIASGDIVDFNLETEWPRYTMNETPIKFDNDVAYEHYQVLFTAIRGPIGGCCNHMQIAEVELLGTCLTAYNPTPVDGAILEGTSVTLSWSPGSTTATHNVYLGENFDDVNDGTESTFQSNQPETVLIVGFFGFPYPDGLVPGTTYYWRIDEVEADGTTVHKGDVWSFSIPPKTAYNPDPPDGAKFVDPSVTLSWTTGIGAMLHMVYFGDNFDDVNNATGGLPLGTATYTPGTLELDKTYYWRVDEFDAINTYKGKVWSFTTAGLGGGVRADYFKGMNFGSYVLTRIDPQINFNWGNSAPDETVGEDNFSVRWTGEVEAVFTETYTFYTNSDDGIRLWVDGQQLVDNWTDHSPTENKGTIDLVGGQTYSVVMEMYENDGGAVAELRWSSPRTPKQLIPQAALSPPVKAGSPNPPNGAVDVKQTPILSWSAGEAAASHQVYFGTDEEAVKNADTGSPEYKSTKDLGSESYDPGKLEWDTTYYWRVDEVETDGTIQKGNVWNFTVADFLIVDDFEDYDIGDNRIWYAWKDGLGYGMQGTELYYAGNGTGSAAGDENTGSYTEESIVHGGRQAMPLFYDNNKQDYFKYSEAELTLTYPRDWTEKGVNTLTIWFRGDSDNAAEPMYVALNGSAVVSHDNPDAAQVTEWTEWNIDLQQFADQGVNLTNVNTIALGLGNKKNPLAGGAGTMYFDDIRLYAPEPETEPAP